jgi:hypothetical protein
MTYEANKYRIRPMFKKLPLQQVERMTRLRAITSIARLLKQGHDAVIKDFHQRTMLPEHKLKLRQIAALWADLDGLEEAIKVRKTKLR